jgi:hypothetical protein
MRSVILACAFGLILLRPSVSLAQEQPPVSERTDEEPAEDGETATVSEEAEPDQAEAVAPDRMICRTVANSGNRLGRARVCHTEQEWVELRRQTMETVEHIENARWQVNQKPEDDPQ